MSFPPLFGASSGAPVRMRVVGLRTCAVGVRIWGVGLGVLFGLARLVGRAGSEGGELLRALCGGGFVRSLPSVPALARARDPFNDPPPPAKLY